jgi:ADP-heptose:LPS heptosyltransferase
MIRNWILKTSDALFGPPACALIAGILSLRGKAKAPAGLATKKPARILIIRPGGIGDMLLLLPSISALTRAFPDAEIDIVCEQRNLPVLELAKIDARCLPYDKNPLKFLLTLIRTEYDVAVDSEQFHHSSAVFAALSDAAVRIGFNINPRRNGLYTHLIPYSPDGFEGEEFLRLLRPLGADERSFHPAVIRVDKPEEELSHDLIDELAEFRRGGQRLVIVHSGASVKRKMWPEDKLAGLIARLAEQPESGVVILGDGHEQRRTERIRSKVPSRKVISISQHLSLKQCAALISMADLFVGPDSGLLHLAVACKVPTVAIFGPSDHIKWGYGGRGRHAVVRNDVPCSPCFIFGYSKPCRCYECIEEISIDDVAKACNRIAASSA